MFLNLRKSIKKILQQNILDERKDILHVLVDYIDEKYSKGQRVSLNFICTHNSRRSQFAQIWAHTAAAYYNLKVSCYSGGIQVTAFDQRAVASIIRSGFKVHKEGDYNPIHYHSGQISGVGYLKVPQDMGKTIQDSKQNNHNGKLVLIDGSKKFLCDPTFVITPKKGDFYFFPSYMMHTVYPFADSSEERRSVSFNAKIDQDAARLR